MKGRMTDDELNTLAEQLWRRMEPFAKVELERLFSNYMATRTMLEPDLVKKLFDAMSEDMQKFVTNAIHKHHMQEKVEHLRRLQEYKEWEKSVRPKPPY